MSTSEKDQVSETVKVKVALLVNAIKIALLHSPAHTFGEYEVLNEDEDGNIAILAQISFKPFDSDEGRITPEPVSIDFEYRVDDNEWLIIVGDDAHELCINESSLISIIYFYSLRPDKEIAAENVYAPPSTAQEGTKEILQTILKCLTEFYENNLLCDKIWLSDGETLLDYIENSIDRFKSQPTAQELTLKNPARVGATTFQPGVRVSTLIDRAEREYIAAQSQEVTPSTIGIAAPPEQEPVNQELIYKIDRDICEGEPYDPEKEDAICISHSALLSTLNAALGDESPRLYTSPQSARRAFPMVTRHKSALREFYKKEHIILAAFHGINLSRDLCTYPECNCPIDKADNGGCLFGLKDSNQEQAATVASEPTEKALMLGAKIYMEADSNQSKSVIEIVGRIYRAMTEAAKEE